MKVVLFVYKRGARFVISLFKIQLFAKLAESIPLLLL